ncbi:MAG: hypothetical protein H6767_00625 [Candidatus Peribacteria bacterium]|nr:MAG: hypothetical protein H6767_00625 [Candidatus Peribacteria bacterium]
MLDANGKATFDTTIDFRSSYYDYKYIVEVTVKDAAGDTISSSNSLIARLPSEYKRWNPDGNLEIHTEKRFYKTGEQVELNANLSIGEWTEGENNKYLLIIKKKDYVTAVLDDVRGYKRPVSEQVEKTQDIILVNDSNFTRTQDGSLQHMYTIPKSGEYIFEYGVIQYNDTGMESGSIDTLVSRLNAGETEILVDTERTFFAEYGEVHDIASICYGDHCSYEDILEQI